jgi:hypothetical protein
MSRPSIVTTLLLLVIVTGDLALASMKHAPLVDVEAVAEWRSECDPGDIIQDDAPDIPVILVHREFVATVTDSRKPPVGLSFIAMTGTVTPATRAPPA